MNYDDRVSIKEKTFFFHVSHVRYFQFAYYHLYEWTSTSYLGSNLNNLNKLFKILYVHKYKFILYFNYKTNIENKRYIKSANTKFNLVNKARMIHTINITSNLIFSHRSTKMNSIFIYSLMFLKVKNRIFIFMFLFFTSTFILLNE